MRIFICLLKKELRSYFYSPLSYSILFFFWLLSGANFYFFCLRELINGEKFIVVSSNLFCGPLIIFSLPIIISLITMKLFSEEQKLGTLENLLTIHVSEIKIVLSKYFSAFIIYLLLWIPLIFYAFIINNLFLSVGFSLFSSNILLSGFINIFFIGLFYIAFGLLMSSLTSNQTVAASSTFAFLFGSLLLFLYIGINTENMKFRTLGQFVSVYHHLSDSSRGILDSRVLLLYFLNTIWLIYSTVKMIEWKRK